MKNKERLDVLLVNRGYFDSRAKAQAVIMSGDVYVDGQKADKAGASFDVEASKLMTFWRDVQDFFAKTAVKIAAIVVAALVVVLVVLKLILGRRRYRYGRSVSRRGRGGYRGRRRR